MYKDYMVAVKIEEGHARMGKESVILNEDKKLTYVLIFAGLLF